MGWDWRTGIAPYSKVGALTLHVSHGDELGRPTPERLLARYAADILVFGHTHQAVLFRLLRSVQRFVVCLDSAAAPQVKREGGGRMQ